MRDTDDRHRYEQSWRQKRYGDDARSESAATPPAAVQAWCFANPEDDPHDPPRVYFGWISDVLGHDQHKPVAITLGVVTSAGEFVPQKTVCV